MISVAVALQKILSHISPTCDEQIPLSKALRRVLATDVTARLTQPRTAVSAMDGYAVRAQDVIAAPTTLTIIGESPAGGCFDNDLKPGQTVRIFTGAPVPLGADAVVMQENTERNGETVKIFESVPTGRFIRPAGLDFKAGDILVHAGKILTARDLGLAAAGNVPWLMVKRKPRIAIIATGDEIVMPGEPLGENQIISSNTVMLAAFIESLGAVALDLGIARDDAGSLKRLIGSANEADLLVTIGGASVGDYDLVTRVLDEEGVDLEFYKVAMRPGKPLIFGTLNNTPVLGLPGNPVSVGVTSIVFLKPAILALMGLNAFCSIDTDSRGSDSTSSASMTKAFLGTDVPENDHRQDYLRATLSNDQAGNIVATPFPKQDSAMLTRFTNAQALIVRAPHAPALRIGNIVDIIKL